MKRYVGPVSLWPPVLVVIGLLIGAQGQAQEPAAPIAVPRVFLDCQGGPQCNDTYYRTEITWVTWVRDQADAHVHVIMTSQGTGVGGREYVLDFMGVGPFGTYEDAVRYQSLPTNTERETLDGVTTSLAAGLAQFSAANGFADVFRIEAGFDPGEGGLEVSVPGQPLPPQGIRMPEEVDDPWNLWVFRVNGNGNLNKQSRSENQRLNFGFNGSRVTPQWNQRYSGSFNYNYRENELSSGTFIDERYNWGLQSRVVYALAEHWSAGFNSNLGRNVTNNQEIWGQWNPAIEYSYFPYDEATRRSLTVFYEVGPVYRSYIEETVYDQTSELRGEQALTIEFSQRQAWGNASLRVSGSNYLHDIRRNNLSFNGNLSFRVARGLDLDVGGSYSRVRDQLYLSGEELTDEERLLQLQREGTEFNASLNFGISYQFGSIFNNVVNNRFPGGGGGGGGGGFN